MMDNPEGDPFADLDAELDAEMNAIGESPPDADMPAPAEIPAPVALLAPNSLFNYGAAPVGSTVLLESKDGNILKTPKTKKVNDSIETGEFSTYAMEFDRHLHPAGLKYAQWFFLEFERPDCVEAVFDQLEELFCDVIGVCVVRPGQCCAVARRTKPRNVMKFKDHFGIKSFFLLRTKSCLLYTSPSPRD